MLREGDSGQGRTQGSVENALRSKVRKEATQESKAAAKKTIVHSKGDRRSEGGKGDLL